jgi:hypothetical protein
VGHRWSLASARLDTRNHGRCGRIGKRRWQGGSGGWNGDGPKARARSRGPVCSLVSVVLVFVEASSAGQEAGIFVYICHGRKAAVCNVSKQTKKRPYVIWGTQKRSVGSEIYNSITAKELARQLNRSEGGQITYLGLLARGSRSSLGSRHKQSKRPPLSHFIPVHQILFHPRQSNSGSLAAA